VIVTKTGFFRIAPPPFRSLGTAGVKAGYVSPGVAASGTDEGGGVVPASSWLAGGDDEGGFAPDEPPPRLPPSADEPHPTSSARTLTAKTLVERREARAWARARRVGMSMTHCGATAIPGANVVGPDRATVTRAPWRIFAAVPL